MSMSEYEKAKFRHPSSRAREKVIIEELETNFDKTAPELDHTEHKVRRHKRGVRRKPRSFHMFWRF